MVLFCSHFGVNFVQPLTRKFFLKVPIFSQLIFANFWCSFLNIKRDSFAMYYTISNHSGQYLIIFALCFNHFIAHALSLFTCKGICERFSTSSSELGFKWVAWHLKPSSGLFSLLHKEMHFLLPKSGGISIFRWKSSALASVFKWNNNVTNL